MKTPCRKGHVSFFVICRRTAYNDFFLTENKHSDKETYDKSTNAEYDLGITLRKDRACYRCAYGHSTIGASAAMEWVLTHITADSTYSVMKFVPDITNRG